MRDPLRHATVAIVLLITVINFCFAQRRAKPTLVCTRPVLAALKPMPELSYPCNEQLNDYDEKILKLPARIAAIKTLMSQLSSFSNPAWWARSTHDLSVCDYTQKPGALTPSQRKSFIDGDYLFWLFGHDHIRLALIPDPCYQTEYGGSNAFVLYRNASRVIVTQVLDGYFSRADNSVNIAFAKLNAHEIVEISLERQSLSLIHTHRGQLCLKSRKHSWIGSVQGAVATWSVISMRYFLTILIPIV